MAQQRRGQCSGESAIVPHDLANARYPCPPTNATTHPLKSPAPRRSSRLHLLCVNWFAGRPVHGSRVPRYGASFAVLRESEVTFVTSREGRG